MSVKRRYEFGHVNGKFVKPKNAREVAAYLSSYFVRGRGHKAPLAEAVTNGELPRLPLYVSRRLTSVTRATMRNKRRQRHLPCATRADSPSLLGGRTSVNGLTSSRSRCRCGIGCGCSRSSGALSCRSCRVVAPHAAPRTAATGQASTARARLPTRSTARVGLTFRCCIAQYETFSRTVYLPRHGGSRRGVTLAAAATAAGLILYDTSPTNAAAGAASSAAARGLGCFRARARRAT